MTEPYRLEPAVNLIRHIAELHDRNVTPPVQLVPVLVSSESIVPELLKSLTGALSGVFIDAELPTFDEPVVTNERLPAVEAALEQALSTTATWAPRTLELSEPESGRLQATFEELPAPSAGSEADLRILRLARGLLQPQIAESAFAVVMVREAGLGPEFRAAIWTLIDQLQGVQIGALRTLVVLIRAEDGISVRFHCTFPNGYRLAHVNDRLRIRNGSEVLSVRSTQFSRQAEPIVLFLGAGFSQSSRLPIGDALRDEALKHLLGADADSMTSVEMAKAFQRSQENRLAPEERVDGDTYARKLTLERVVSVEREHFGSLPTLEKLRDLESDALAAPGEAVERLHELIDAGARIVIVTVNFDRLIESGVEDRVRVFATDADFEGAADYVTAYLAGSENEVPVLKLHGSLSDLDSCVVTDHQTKTGLPTAKARAFRALAGTAEQRRTWIYVGASMRDLDLNKELSSAEFGNGISEYWVVPSPIDTIEEFARDRVEHWRDDRVKLHTLQERLVTVTADVFMRSLARAWLS